MSAVETQCIASLNNQAEGSPDETSFIAKHESGTGIFTQQRQLLQVGKAAQRTGSSAPSTQHFQVSQSWEKPTTKHESMIFSQMVLQIEGVLQ